MKLTQNHMTSMNQRQQQPSFLERLTASEGLLCMELRPPRSDVAADESMDAWMSMHQTMRHLLNKEVPFFLTDSAVGQKEEENLRHLLTNLTGVPNHEIACPFLTTKHSLEYCLWYAARVVDSGCTALTVLGGDHNVGNPRCVPHAWMLRKRIREKYPMIELGGWANPHAETGQQVDYLLDEDAHADFYLTQLVSHHSLAEVERLLKTADDRGLTIPAVFGVFLYRSMNPKTLARLSKFFPVPVEGLTRDFSETGITPEGICARSIKALHSLGVRHVYISNLHVDRAPAQLRRILSHL